MRIATYNINGVKARLPRLLEWLEETQPDIACLQEVKSQDEGFPVADFERAGYGAIWHGQKSFNGVAILAKGAQPIEAQRTLPGDPLDEHARYLEADVFGIRVASIYLPNGNPIDSEKFPYKLTWLDALTEHCKNLRAQNIAFLIGKIQFW
jgi:exodeoxyribonuclease-3